ncbi:glycoside hydrolase family 26 protein [Kitasatospora indigofera]|uniref:endo-1,3-beta-xylanase n=1 Tax=Kitasatospora indigofera TaxID=67307 RepID=UPI0036A8CBC6
MRPFRRAGLAAVAAFAAAAALLASPAGQQPAQAAVSARNLPADGKILSIMGQDSDTLAQYKTDVVDKASLNAPRPGGVTLYTNLVLGGSPEPLAGIVGPADWGAGRVDFNSTLAQYPGSALAVGLYLSDATSGCNNQPLRAIIGRADADVTAGSPSLITQYRAKVDQMVNSLKGYNRPVYLRIGYEFDGPWNCYSADFYKQAFVYIKGRIDALGAANVATVWQSAAWPLNANTDHPEWNYVVTDPNHFNAWYPGDQYVDWVALSSFYGAGSLGTQWGCSSYDTAPGGLQNRVLDFARSHGKPVMIAESAPQGYQTGAHTKSCIFKKNKTAATGQTIWNEWYAPYFAWINQNRDVVRAAAYINTDWDSQTLWQCADGASAGGAGCSNGYWGDSRIQADPTVLANFLGEIRGGQWVNGSGSTPPPATGSPAPPSPSASPSPSNSPSPSPSPSPTGSQAPYTQGVAGGSAPVIWFKPAGFTATFVTVHYTVNGGAQGNYFLTWNPGAGRWEQPVTVKSGDRVTYWFDYQPTSQTSQVSTPTWTVTV